MWRKYGVSLTTKPLLYKNLNILGISQNEHISFSEELKDIGNLPQRKQEHKKHFYLRNGAMLYTSYLFYSQ